MLIHVTRFVDVQQQVYELVDKYLVDLRSQIRNGDRHVFEILKKLWNDEFIVKSKEMEKMSFGLLYSFDDIRSHLVTVMENIGVPLRINGEAGDILEYDCHKKRKRNNSNCYWWG